MTPLCCVLRRTLLYILSYNTIINNTVVVRVQAFRDVTSIVGVRPTLLFVCTAPPWGVDFYGLGGPLGSFLPSPTPA